MFKGRKEGSHKKAPERFFFFNYINKNENHKFWPGPDENKKTKTYSLAVFNTNSHNRNNLQKADKSELFIKCSPEQLYLKIKTLTEYSLIIYKHSPVYLVGCCWRHQFWKPGTSSQVCSRHCNLSAGGKGLFFNFNLFNEINNLKFFILLQPPYLEGGNYG